MNVPLQEGKSLLQGLLDYVEHRIWTAAKTLRSIHRARDERYAPSSVWGTSENVKANVKTEVRLVVSVLAVATGYGFSLQVPRFVQNAHRYFMHGGIEWSEVVPVSAEEPISVRYPIVLPNWWELGKFDTHPHLCDVQRLANRFLHHVFHDGGAKRVNAEFMEEFGIVSEKIDDAVNEVCRIMKHVSTERESAENELIGTSDSHISLGGMIG